MAEQRVISFEYKEMTELLIKQADVHEGLWGIAIEFNLAVANVSATMGVGPIDMTNLLPAAIAAVKRIGIQRFDQPNNLTVDAAQVNPAKQKAK